MQKPVIGSDLARCRHDSGLLHLAHRTWERTAGVQPNGRGPHPAPPRPLKPYRSDAADARADRHLPTALPDAASFLMDRVCSTLIITYSTAAATSSVRTAVSPAEAPVRARKP